MREPTKTVTRGWIVLAALVALATLAPTQGPRLSHARGPVEIGVGEPPSWKAARSGDPIAAGDAVRTGAGASAELVLGTRTVRLYENSVLRIPAEAVTSNGPRAVELQRGRGLFDVLRQAGGDAFDVRTPEVVVSVKGTRFLVDAGGHELAAAVSVFRGEVGVRALAQELAHEVRVRPGFTALSGAGRALELELTPFDDPWQAWTSGTPAPRAAPAARQVLTPAKAAMRDAKAAAERLAERGLRPGKVAPTSEGAPRGPGAAKPSFEKLPGARGTRVDPLGDRFKPGVEEGTLAPSVPPGGSPPGSTFLPGALAPGGGVVPGSDGTLVSP